jgi:hypothetical protein
VIGRGSWLWGLGVVGCLGPNPAFDEPRESGSGSGVGSAGATTASGGSAESDAASEVSGGPLDASCDAGDPELVLCFDFETLSDDVLVDGSMYGHHATATDVMLVGSPWGRAIATTEASRIEVPCFEECEAMNALTLESRVRLEGPPPMGQRIGVVDNDLEYAITYSGMNGLRCSTGGGSELTGPELPLGEWVHVACTYDGADIRAYVDGVEVASVAQSGSVGTGDPSPIAVANTAPNWNEPFVGALDRLRVYRRARSAAEICDEVGC